MPMGLFGGGPSYLKLSPLCHLKSEAVNVEHFSEMATSLKVKQLEHLPGCPLLASHRPFVTQPHVLHWKGSPG